MAVTISTAANTAKARVKQNTDPAKASKRRSSKFMTNCLVWLMGTLHTKQLLMSTHIHK